MALDENNIIWEVRPTNGSDSNGGGFVSGASGTDFSQQNSPQQAYTDLVAATTTTITSVGRPFSSVDVGNLINITSGTGWTTGWYQITGVTGSTATVDRAIATLSSTGGHGNLGGALKTWNQLAAINDGATASITQVNAYVKAEATITITTRPDFQHLTSLAIFGYTTTRSDNGKVSVTTSNGTDTLILMRGTGILNIQNIAFSDTSGTRHQAISFVNNINQINVINCTFDGHSKGIDWNGVTILRAHLKQVTIKNSTGAGISIQVGTFVYLDDCFIHDNTGNGVDILATATTTCLIAHRSVFRANSIGIKSVDDGAAAGQSCIILKNCNIISNTSDGIKHVGTGTNFPVLTSISNCIIYGNTGIGVNIASVANVPNKLNFGENNAYGANSGGDKNNFPALTGDVVLTANPFTSDTTGDLSLNSTSGGGPVCKQAGFPSTFP